jgi:hypothetical protein
MRGAIIIGKTSISCASGISNTDIIIKPDAEADTAPAITPELIPPVACLISNVVSSLIIPPVTYEF